MSVNQVAGKSTVSRIRIARRDFLKQASALAAAAAVGFETRSVSAVSQGRPTTPEQAGGASLQFSLAHLTVLGCAPPEMTYLAARAGYDFVSYRPIYMGLPGEANYDLAANKTLLQQTRTALKTTGVKLLDIELARVTDGLDPRRYLPAMEVAAELGARHVISSIWTVNRSWAIECFGRICDLAKPLGLTVDLEFVTFASCRTLREAVDVLRAVGAANGGLLVDMLHFTRSRVALEELDSVPREWFHFAHLCDAPAEIPTTDEELIHTARDARLHPGEGGLDIAGILRRMPAVPYSIEIPHLARARELGYAEHAWRCLQASRAYLEAHPRG